MKIKYNKYILKKVNTVIVVYQRKYINYMWCIGSHEPYYTLIFNTFIKYDDILNLKCIIRGNKIKCNNCEAMIF